MMKSKGLTSAAVHDGWECGDLLSLLDARIRHIAEEVIEREQSSSGAGSKAEELSVRIARIRAKDFLSASEAALLLGCSDGHLRNLVREAKKGRKRHPVPFCDLDGVYTFPREELLRWAAEPKARLRKVEPGGQGQTES